MYGNRVVSGDLEMEDTDYINVPTFRKLPPPPRMESNRPTKTAESCFQKNWSITSKVSLLGLIALLSIVLIIVCAHFSAASVQVEEGKENALTTQLNVLGSISKQEHVICPEAWIRRGNSCYSFTYEPEKWQDAFNNCARQQSKLLTLTSKEELDNLLPLITGRAYWIGLKNCFSSWTWVDGNPLTFTNWSPNEPNNVGGNEFCVEMKTDGWNDINCDMKLYYVCKK